MKEKIGQLSREIFEYEQPEIILSQPQLALEVEAGTEYKGSFVIRNSKQRVMKGMLKTDNRCITLLDEQFEGVENEISFVFHGEYKNPGDYEKGVISIITDCGECNLPFMVNIEIPSCSTSVGKIKNLFHFAGLAKEDPGQADKLFKSPFFEHIFLYKDYDSIALYRGLRKGTMVSQQLEEFLVSTKKKLPVHIRADKERFVYKNCKDIIGDQVVILRDNWGHACYDVRTEGTFLSTKNKHIWSDNFIGNAYELLFEVDSSKLRDGVNYGRICISTLEETIYVTIEAHCAKQLVIDEEEQTEDVMQKQSRMIDICDNYLQFRMNRMAHETYIEEMERVIARMDRVFPIHVLEMYRLHIAILDEREAAAAECIDKYASRIERVKKSSVLTYCAYYYLKALYTKDPADITEATERIQKEYQNGHRSWQVLWFLLYLDKKYENRTLKLNAVLEQIEAGCHSPIMYYEAVALINEEPKLCNELSPAGLESVLWAVKNDCLSLEAALHVNYLISRSRKFNSQSIFALGRLYNRYLHEDFLSTICSVLIKAGRTEEEYFRWYALGVEKNLRIAELFEHYMYACPKDYSVELPKQVLLYFLYENHLNMETKEFLFSYIVRHKNDDEETYGQYLAHMRKFAWEELEKKRVSKYLSVLYEDFITPDSIDKNLAKVLPSIMYQYEVCCEHREIVGVYVLHRELEDAQYVPLKEGKAIVQMFTDGAKLVFVDEKGNSYATSVSYTLNRLVNLDDCAQACYTHNKDDKRLLLYLYEKNEAFNRTGDVVVNIRRRVMELPDLSITYKRRCHASLAKYYYDNYEGDLLDEMLRNLNWEYVGNGHRGEFIQYCIIRKIFDKAVEGMKLYGFEDVSRKYLMQVCESEISRLGMDEPDAFLLELCNYVYMSGKFNEQILMYLMKFYIGTVRELFGIWRTAGNFDISRDELEERLLAQMVFTSVQMPGVLSIFQPFYEKGVNHRLVRAYLNGEAYAYIIRDRVLDESIFEYMKKEIVINDSHACVLALLKYYSTKETLTEEEMDFVQYHVEKEIQKGIIFPFFKNYKGGMVIPYQVKDTCIVEYICDPTHRVQIHYRILDGNADVRKEDGEFETRELRNVYEGVHSMEFVLFHNDVLQYYIVERDGEEETITESVSINMENEIKDDVSVDSRYHNLNLMLIAKEMQDEKTMFQLMEDYAKDEAIRKSIFKPL